MDALDNHKKPVSSFRYCIVPKCRNTSRNTPDKVFLAVPRGELVRRKWCQIMRRDMISLLSPLYCCEVHFELENDIANYIEYKIMKGKHKTVLRLKKGVVPHKFQCQLENQTQEGRERKKLLKKKYSNTNSSSSKSLGRVAEEDEEETESEDENFRICDKVNEEPQPSTSRQMQLMDCQINEQLLPNDMENYMQYSVMGSVRQIRMKPGCVPTKFQCQPDRIKRTAPLQPRSAVSKRQHMDIIQEIFSGQVKLEPPSSDDGTSDPIPNEEKNYEIMVEVKAEPKEEPEVVVKEEIFEFDEHPPEIQIEDYKTLYFKLKQEISNLETENQRLTEENKMLNEKLQNFTNKVEKILQKHEKDKVKNDSESVKDIESVIIKNLKIDNRNLADQNKSLAMKIDEVIKQNHLQMKEIQELTEKNKSLSDEIQELMDKNKNLSVRIQECKYCTQHFASVIQSVEIEADSGQVEDGNTLVRDVQSLTEEARRLEEENEQQQIVLYPVSSGLTIEVMTEDKTNQVVKENRKRKKVDHHNY